MLLAETKIETVVEGLRNNQLNVISMNLKINTNESHNKKPHIILHSHTEIGVQQEHEYYDNIMDNLIALQLQVIEPFFQHLQGIFELNIPVKDSGDFVMDQIEVTMQLFIPESVDKLHYHLYTRLKPYCLLYKFLHRMEFKGSFGHLKNVTFSGIISSLEVASIFKKSQINYNVLNQWMTIADKVKRDIEMDRKQPYSNSFRVVGGKMHYENRTICRTNKFFLQS